MDENGHVRSAAAEALGRLRSRKAVPPLLTLLADEYESVQESAIRALAEIGDESVLDGLVKDFTSRDARMRRNIALLLGKFSTERAVDALAFALKDEEPEVRKAVVHALGNMSGASARTVRSCWPSPTTIPRCGCSQRRRWAGPACPRRRTRSCPCFGTPISGSGPRLPGAWAGSGGEAGRAGACGALVHGQPISFFWRSSRCWAGFRPAGGARTAPAAHRPRRPRSAQDRACRALGLPLGSGPRGRRLAGSRTALERAKGGDRDAEAEARRGSRAAPREDGGAATRMRRCGRRRRKHWEDKCSKSRPFRCRMMSSGSSGISSTATAASISTTAPSSCSSAGSRAGSSSTSSRASRSTTTFSAMTGSGRKSSSVLVDNLTTNETYFFRESPQLRAFSEEILPELRRTLADRKSAPDLERRLLHRRGALYHRHPAAGIRRLVARLAGGDPRERHQPARPAHGAQGCVQEERPPRHEPGDAGEVFRRRGQGRTTGSSIRCAELVSFSSLNLLDPYKTSLISNMDVIFCRNVIIYFDQEAKKKVIESFLRQAPRGRLPAPRALGIADQHLERLCPAHAQERHGLSEAGRGPGPDMSARRGETDAAAMKKIKALVVDDSAYNRMAITQMLASDGRDRGRRERARRRGCHRQDAPPPARRDHPRP